MTNKHGRYLVALLMTLFSVNLRAQIINPGFEEGWAGWSASDPNGSGTALSDEAHSGDKSVKLVTSGVFVSQSVQVQAQTTYRLTVYVRGLGSVGAKVGADLYFEQQTKRGKKWRPVSVTFSTADAQQVAVFVSGGNTEVRFDDFTLQQLDNESDDVSARLMVSSAGGSGLSPDLPPGRNFDLLGWYLNTPADDNNDGRSDRLSEIELAKGATDQRYFFTASDGGMVFRATIAGAKTSKNTKFTRTELREMLRRGNQDIRTKTDSGQPNANNWVLSSAPKKAQRAAGAIDGVLRATLTVDHVTTTGDSGQIGRVIIGQIHAKNDEPIRLYYRKLPGNTRGSVYAAHEISDGDDVYFELLGNRSNSAADPVNGIALGEKFSYEIAADGNMLSVTISRDGAMLASEVIDMTGSGYDVVDDYMYFKAGVYNQNNSGNPDDYVQATFYALTVSHESP
ncbi:MAG: polysaccharide lyase family 7 protein [Pseudomonadota bacterium]